MSRYSFSISIFIAHNSSFLAGWRRLTMTMTMSMLRVDLSTIWAARSKKPRRVRVLPRVLRRPAQCSISLISQDSGEHRQLSAPSCPLCLCCVIFRYLCIWLGSSLLSPPPPVWSRWGAAPAPSPDITRWSHSSGGHTQLQCRAGQIYSPWSQQISSHLPFIKNTKQTMHEDTFNMTAMLYMDSYFLCMHASPLRIQ